MTKKQRNDLTIQFLIWHLRRFQNYARNRGLTEPEAAKMLCSLPSFEQRKDEQDQHCDPFYHSLNRPDKNLK